MVNVRALVLLVVGLCLVSAPLLFRAPIPRSVQLFSFPFRVLGLVVMFYSLRTYRGEPIGKTLKYLLLFFLFIIGASLAVTGVYSIEHAPFVLLGAHIKMLRFASAAAFGYGAMWSLLGAFCIWLGLRLIPKFRNERAAAGDPIDKTLRYILLFFLFIIGLSLAVTGVSSIAYVPPILIDASKQKHLFVGAFAYGALCSLLGAFCIWLGLRLIPQFRNKASKLSCISAVFAVLTLMLVGFISAVGRGLDGELVLIIPLIILLCGVLAFVALGIQNRQQRGKYLHYLQAFVAVFNFPIGTISSRDILNPAFL